VKHFKEKQHNKVQIRPPAHNDHSGGNEKKAYDKYYKNTQAL
jgi:hypothetical protein